MIKIFCFKRFIIVCFLFGYQVDALESLLNVPEAMELWKRTFTLM